MFDGIGAVDRLGAARELMQRGDLDGALAEVDRVIGLGKSVEALELKSEILGAIVGRNRVVVAEVSAEEFYNRAMQYYLAGDFQVAVDAFQQALACQPDYPDAWVVLGNSFNHLDQYEEAIASYDKALAYKSDYALAFYNRGWILRNLDRHEEALKAFEDAVKYQPDYVDLS
jgi:tetratricopeptide (TPR) repeat protein